MPASISGNDKLPALRMSPDELPPPDPGAGDAALATLSDEELVARAQKQDVAAFEELLSRHEEKIYRLAMRFTRNETDAAEVLQETFLSTWRNLGSFQGKAQFTSWLYRVAANASLMLLRSQRRHPQVAVEDVAPAALDQATAAGPTLGAGTDWSKRPDEQFQSEELRRHIQGAVNALPESQQAVFLLRDVEGMSTEETADLLGVTVPTVKTRLHRARLSLRAAISHYFAKA
jgi:RNA polymerase sigma-70 factor, ECF subfamily